MKTTRMMAVAGFGMLLAAALVKSQAPPEASGRVEVRTEPGLAARVYVLKNGEPFRVQPVEALLPVKSDTYYRDRLWLEGADPDVLEVIANDLSHYFLLKGRANFHLPPGKYAMEAYRGFFYEPVMVEFEVKAGETARVTLPLKQWARAEEWISADDHIHLTRTERENPVFLAWLDAEDLNVGNFLALQRKSDAAPQYAFGKAGEYRGRGYVIRSGHETRNQAFGHVLMLGGDKLVRPMSTGEELANTPEDYPFHSLLFDVARKAGALTGYAHFREVPVKSTFYMDLALGHVRLAEVFQFGVLTMEPWYELWNAGFRVTGVAGSDFPVYLQRLGGKYPRRLPLLGPERALVKKRAGAAAGTADVFGAWAEGVRSGDVVVTNGPLVEVSVEGAEAKAVGTFFRPLEKLEIVRNGVVVAAVKGDGVTKRLTASVKWERGGWYAARVKGKAEEGEPEAWGHTNAVYPSGTVFEYGARYEIAERWAKELKRYREAGMRWGSSEREREFFAMGERALEELRRPLMR